MSALTKCPLCGGTVLYCGPIRLECNNMLCANAAPELYPADEVTPIILDPEIEAWFDDWMRQL